MALLNSCDVNIFDRGVVRRSVQVYLSFLFPSHFDWCVFVSGLYFASASFFFSTSSSLNIHHLCRRCNKYLRQTWHTQAKQPACSIQLDVTVKCIVCKENHSYTFAENFVESLFYLCEVKCISKILFWHLMSSNCALHLRHEWWASNVCLCVILGEKSAQFTSPQHLFRMKRIGGGHARPLFSHFFIFRF